MTAERTVNHAFAQTLARAGVRRIFTLSGNQIMPQFDACIDADIELVHVRHEAAAVYMAEASAQLSGEIGVAMLTAGPGFLNGLTPLYSARCSETPVLLISGDAPRAQDGRGAFQELDQVSVSAPLTKQSMRATSADSLCRDLASLIRTARSGRPGPVHLAVPFDIINEQASPALPAADEFVPPAEEPRPGVLAVIGERLARAQRPLVLTGPALSASRAHGLIAQLSARLAAPVLSMESPRGLADPSLGDLRTILNEVDVVLSLGKAIDFTLNFGASPTFNDDCVFLVVDPDACSLERARGALEQRAAALELADAGAVARALCELEPGSSETRIQWQDRVARAVAARGTVETGRPGGIHPAILCAAVQRALNAARNPILVCDGGEFGQWAQACATAPTRLINGISGAIGGGLCYAVAARLNRPQATVVALMGDGTVGFHLSEFETALRNNAPMVAVVGHDARWNAEVQIQIREYGPERRIATDLLDTRYDLAVKGMGGHGEYVEQASELDAALRRAIDSGLPACVNVRIEGLPAPSGSGH